MSGLTALYLENVQGLAKERSLGCVIPASWSPLAAGACFTKTPSIISVVALFKTRRAEDAVQSPLNVCKRKEDKIHSGAHLLPLTVLSPEIGQK